MSAGLGSFLEALEQNELLAFSSFLRLLTFLDTVLPFSKPAQWVESSSHRVTLTFSSVVLSPFASLLYFPFLLLRKVVIILRSPK